VISPISDSDFLAIIEEMRLADGGGPILASEIDDDPPYAEFLRDLGVNVTRLVEYLFKAKFRVEDGYIQFDLPDNKIQRVSLYDVWDEKIQRTRRKVRYPTQCGTNKGSSYIDGKIIIDAIKAVGPRNSAGQTILMGVIHQVINEMNEFLMPERETISSQPLESVRARSRIIAELLNWLFRRGGRPTKYTLTEEKVRKVIEADSKHYGTSRHCLPLTISEI
jgi:hypothetical protein